MVFGEERRQKILAKLAEEGRVLVTDLVALLAVFTDTVRLDLS